MAGMVVGGVVTTAGPHPMAVEEIVADPTPTAIVVHFRECTRVAAVPEEEEEEAQVILEGGVEETMKILMIIGIIEQLCLGQVKMTMQCSFRRGKLIHKSIGDLS